MNTETEQNRDKDPNANREDWNVEQLTNESTNKSSDEIRREVLRGDETRGDADARDIVGGIDSNETPQGREETKRNETRLN